jgi:large subunit ribosomal protein L10
MSSAVFLDFTGMTVEEVSKLRDVFRAKGIEYKVVKNKLVQQATRRQAVEQRDSRPSSVA